MQSFWVSQYHPNNFNLLCGGTGGLLPGMEQIRSFSTPGWRTVHNLCPLWRSPENVGTFRFEYDRYGVLRTYS